MMKFGWKERENFGGKKTSLKNSCKSLQIHDFKRSFN